MNKYFFFGQAGESKERKLAANLNRAILEQRIVLPLKSFIMSLNLEIQMSLGEGNAVVLIPSCFEVALKPCKWQPSKVALEDTNLWVCFNLFYLEKCPFIPRPNSWMGVSRLRFLSKSTFWTALALINTGRGHSMTALSWIEFQELLYIKPGRLMSPY